MVLSRFPLIVANNSEISNDMILEQIFRKFSKPLFFKSLKITEILGEGRTNFDKLRSRYFSTVLTSIHVGNINVKAAEDNKTELEKKKRSRTRSSITASFLTM